MADEGFKRKLAAILSADVEGHPTEVAWIVDSLVFKRK